MTMSLSRRLSLLPTIAAASLALMVGLIGCKGSAGGSGPITEPFSDSFDRAALGSDYTMRGGTWEIKDGALHSRGDKNIPLWLNVKLPKNVKVEFDAWSKSAAVDTKVEIFGDGLNHESGYIVIFGGWNNSITTIARLDEHEKTRVEKRTKWEKDRKYRWTVQRQGNELEFLVDGTKVLGYADKEPLYGPRNNQLAFTNWESDVYYDNLKITPLP
jgi:hypothetical protein